MSIKELQLQTIIVDAVAASGGFARKIAHRHLIGVSDLLVKLPGFPAALIEVKKHICGPKSTPEAVPLEVTVPQARFLRDAHRAGMSAGVASFVVNRDGQRHHLDLAIWCIDRFPPGKDFYIPLSDYHLLTDGRGQGTLRDQRIVNALASFLGPYGPKIEYEPEDR